jgi:type I restriction enzyme S subunit
MDHKDRGNGASMNASTTVLSDTNEAGRGDVFDDSLKVLTNRQLRRFKRYSAYKDSGVEWLGEIPAHWGVKRIKYLAQVNPDSLSEDADPTREIQYIDIGSVDGLGRIVESTPFTFAVAPSRARRLVEDGDVIISTVRTYLRAIAQIRLPEPGTVVSTGFAVIRPNNHLTTSYAAYALRAPFLVERVVANSKGVSFPAINESELATYELAVPPAHEQQEIGAFLDRKTSTIDMLISKKERVMELLQERRNAKITRAVTLGLESNAPMKDSGIEWLGKIPAHWTTKKLKAVSSLQTGLTLGQNYDGASVVTRPYLRVANVQDGYLDLEDITQITLPASDALRYQLRSGDVLMTEGGDFDKLGRGHIWDGQIAHCLHQNHIFAVRPSHEFLNPHYLALVMRSGYGRAYFTATSKQSTNLASTNSTKLGNLPMPIPDLVEQERIVIELRREMSKIDSLIADVRMAIGKINELRTSLISAAVTGKIDVREEVA